MPNTHTHVTKKLVQAGSLLRAVWCATAFSAAFTLLIHSPATLDGGEAIYRQGFGLVLIDLPRQPAVITPAKRAATLARVARVHALPTWFCVSGSPTRVVYCTALPFPTKIYGAVYVLLFDRREK